MYIISHVAHEYCKIHEAGLSSLEETHPKVLAIEAGDFRVGGPDVVEVRQERVHVVQALDPFVESGHDRLRVLGQLHARRLLLLRLHIPKLGEHV